jgi:5-hydroxyisourate hydrolase
LSTVSTHVLDTALGQPAAGVPVRLERMTGGGTPLAEAVVAAIRAATGRPLARVPVRPEDITGT